MYVRKKVKEGEEFISTANKETQKNDEEEVKVSKKEKNVIIDKVEKENTKGRQHKQYD